MSELAHLAALASAIASGTPARAWVESGDLIARQREAVVAHLAEHPDRPVYGFTTLLGPLDKYPSDRAGLQEVVDAHLVGRPRPLEARWGRAIHGAKLAQLAQGGSGISSEAHRRACERFGRPFGTDLLASYGSGDVVPASWWLAELFDVDELAQGDYIALVNGCFVGVGAAAMALARFEEVLVDALGLFAFACQVHPAIAPPGWRRELLQALVGDAPVPTSGVQRSVFQRDLGAHLLPVLDAVRAAEAALDDALARPSANPLFIETEDGVQPLSQSSFLALGVRLALEQVVSATVLVSGLLQRCAEFGGQVDDDGSSTPLGMGWVQPPKVSQAISHRVAGVGGPGAYTGSLSGGVEDLWDGLLARALELDGLVDLLHEQVDIAVTAGHPRLPADRVRQLLRGPLCLLGLSDSGRLPGAR